MPPAPAGWSGSNPRVDVWYLRRAQRGGRLVLKVVVRPTFDPICLVAMSTLPDYSSPPIGEVAIGVRFLPVPGLTLPLVGAFWSQLRDQFPETEHAIPAVDGQGNVALDPATQLPWPRLWMISPDKTRLLQIQSDRLLLNWRRIAPDCPYPRYPELLAQFERLFAAYVSFVEKNCGGADIQLTACELTYVNHIAFEHDTSPAKIAEAVFSKAAWQPPVPGAKLAGFGWLNTYRLDDELGALNLRCAPGSRSADMHPLVILELSVQGVATARDDSTDPVRFWMNKAHESIVTTFAAITDPEVQVQRWGLK